MPGEINPKINGANSPASGKMAGIGYNVIPTVNGSVGNIAIGDGAIASYTTAIGPTHNNAIAIGKGAKAYGSSITIGSGASSGIYPGNVAIGQNANVGAVIFSVAIGYGTSCNSSGGVAIGQSSSAGGGNSVTIGYSASAAVNANNAIAIGSGVYANTPNCLAMGSGATATSAGEFVYSSGSFATGGFSTTAASTILLQLEVSNTTPTQMGCSIPFTSVPTGRIILANKSAYHFKCQMLYSPTTATTATDIGVYEFEFVMFRGANAAATTIGPINTVAIQAGLGTFAITADTIAGGPSFTFTAGATGTFRCVCRCHITRMTISA